MTGFLFFFVFFFFSVAYWMRGHLVVKAHSWANSIVLMVLQSHQKEMCGWQTIKMIAWLS